LIVVLAAAACSSGDDDAAAPTSTIAELLPASEVEVSRLVDAAVPVGSTLTIAGVQVTVVSVEAGNDGESDYVVASVRAENRSSDELTVPQLSIRCSNSTEEGGSLVGSTFDAGGAGALPAGSFSEGELLMLLPGDSRLGEPVPPCELPAVIQATELVTFPDAPTYSWELPANVIP
jgi:hypothetical protein